MDSDYIKSLENRIEQLEKVSFYHFNRKIIIPSHSISTEYYVDGKWSFEQTIVSTNITYKNKLIKDISDEVIANPKIDKIEIYCRRIGKHIDNYGIKFTYDNNFIWSMRLEKRWGSDLGEGRSGDAIWDLTRCSINGKDPFFIKSHWTYEKLVKTVRS